jgi:hypothetical protein
MKLSECIERPVVVLLSLRWRLDRSQKFAKQRVTVDADPCKVHVIL